jgi:ribonuclease J
MAKKQGELKVIPLGGLNEIGKNMTIIQYDDEMIVIDCGLAFPSDDMLGIDIVIPDFTFLRNNIDKVKGIFLTHGHEDHIGAVPYVLKEISTPLYGTRLTLGIVENKLKEHRISDDIKKNVVTPGIVMKIGSFEIEYVRMCHSIPEGCAIYIKTPAGNIFHTGDFKIDYTPIDGQRTDLGRIAEIGSEGVLLLMADSTNVERPGYTLPERVVGETFDEIFRNAIGRIIVASFSSNIHRIQQVVHAAEMSNRKIAINGRSMVNITTIAREYGYLQIDESMIVDVRDMDRYPENEICMLTTGSQGEPMSALTRMANLEHRNAEIMKGDLVVFSSSPIPGNEKSVKKVINLLYERGAEVVYDSLKKVHVSGHACKEELKIIHSLVKPKYFMPVHGEFSHLKHHARLAENLGMSKDAIFVLANGNVLEMDSSGARFGKKVPSGRSLIDGLGIGDIGNTVLNDRKMLADEGVIIVVIAISKETGSVVSGPDIVTRGFVYMRESQELISSARTVVVKSLDKCTAKNIRKWSEIKKEIRGSLNDYLYQKTKRTPVILPIITEV